jgi:hypothetical protein
VRLIYNIDKFETTGRLLGSNFKVETINVMPSGRLSEFSRPTRMNTIRHYSAWFLCGVLLLFCANAKTARYGSTNRIRKLATTQSYLDNEQARLQISIAALLLLWFVSVRRAPRAFAGIASANAAGVPIASKFGEFSRESHLRPPPTMRDNCA